MKPSFPIGLSIAGFDGSGGAGMQADLKTFSACGVFGVTVLTSLPIQNTQGVRKVYDLPIESIEDQLDCIFEDMDIQAVKIGMLHRTDTIRLVSAKIQLYKPKIVVVDPVMVAKSGHRLLQESAVQALKDWILPLATVLTPNLPEAEDLLGRKISTESEMEIAGRDILRIGRESSLVKPLSDNRVVVVKGGHLEGVDSSDCVVTEDGKIHWVRERRIDSKNTHGTGCTFSAALASELAKGNSLQMSVQNAKTYLTLAMQASKDLEIGKGKGPVHFFHNWW